MHAQPPSEAANLALTLNQLDSDQSSERVEPVLGVLKFGEPGSFVTGMLRVDQCTVAISSLAPP
jgi:hypothetical protein